MQRETGSPSAVWWLAFAFVIGATVRSGRADVLVLHNGGEIHGQWINRDDLSANSYVMATPRGGVLVLAKDQVKQAIRQRPEEIQYDQIAPGYADTVTDQWRLAEWCREHLLHPQRKTHLQRVIELEPDHVAARRALGYSQVDGEWVTKNEIRQRDGYLFYRGRWRLAQEIELIEERDKAEQAENEWRANLRRWRTYLEGDRGRQAYQSILDIRDTHAVRPLVDQIAGERYRAFKMLYIDALGNIADSQACGGLIFVSLNDPDEEVFHACVDQIESFKTPLAVELYIRALKNENNVRVNRAAAALARLGDPSAISPLIDALITTHKVEIAARSPGSTTTTFMKPGNGAPSPTQGTGISSGDGSKTYLVTVPNVQVLESLVSLSGTTGYGFDEKAWRVWHSAFEASQEPTSISSRRD